MTFMRYRPKESEPETWSERLIGRALSTEFFRRSHLVMVPNCNWTGYECDILAVAKCMRVIDIEIKISRSDLKADAKKDKWWNYPAHAWNAPRPDPVPRHHPPKVWKHYYCLPADIWSDDLIDCLPSKASGVLLLFRRKDGGYGITVKRKATTNKAATKLEASHAIDLARLASLRMWDAYINLDNANSSYHAVREELNAIKAERK